MLWTSQYDRVRLELEVALDICLKWQDACQKHTGVFWPRENHQWDGPPFVPTYVVGFTQRLLHVGSLIAASNVTEHYYCLDPIIPLSVNR